MFFEEITTYANDELKVFVDDNNEVSIWINDSATNYVALKDHEVEYVMNALTQAARIADRRKEVKQVPQQKVDTVQLQYPRKPLNFFG